MKTLQINSKKHGSFTIKYSDEDHDLISSLRWHIHKTQFNSFYATSKNGTMHRLLMGNPNGMVDHINRDTLDNTRNNLRIVTASQSNINKNKYSRLNRFKGVSYDKNSNKYRARVTVDNNVIYGGYFKSEIEAAKKYNELALKYHGNYAVINNI